MKSTYFTSERYPNTHITVIPEGVRLTVTLNIESKMIPFLNPKCIFRGREHHVYSVSAFLPQINKQVLNDTHNCIMQGMMLRLCDAKIAVLNQEKLTIQQQIIF
jgi:hypothetical protein